MKKYRKISNTLYVEVVKALKGVIPFVPTTTTKSAEAQRKIMLILKKIQKTEEIISDER